METAKEFCCEVFPKIVASFNWMIPEGSPNTLIMPNITTKEAKWRINYCPSCGKEVRSIAIDREVYRESFNEIEVE